MLRLALASLLALILAAPAGAAWSPPQTVSAPHTFVGPLFVSAGNDASILAAWRWQDGVGQQADVGASAAGRSARGRFTSEKPAPTELLDVGTYGERRAIGISQTLVSPGTQRFRVAVAFGDTAGRFGAARTVAVARTALQPRLAVGSEGHALATWIEITARDREIVRAAARAPGGRFGRPFTIADNHRTDAVAAAASGRGDFAVVYVAAGRVLARVKRPGHRWGAIHTLATARRATRWGVTAAFDDDARLEVVWRRYQLRQSPSPPTKSLEARYLTAGGTAFSKPQVVEPDGASPPVLIPMFSGGFALGYIEATAAGPVPRVRLTENGRRFGSAHDAAPAAGGLRDVTVVHLPTVGVLAGWIRPLAGGNGDGRGEVALMPPGGEFGPLEAATPDENVHEMRLAVGPSALPVAFWTARPEGTGPGIPIDQIRSVVRAAVRN